MSEQELDEGSKTVNPSGGQAALIRSKIYVEKAVKQGRWERGVVGTKGQQSHQQLCHHHSLNLHRGIDDEPESRGAEGHAI